jgi:hypothetical protein
VLEPAESENLTCRKCDGWIRADTLEPAVTERLTLVVLTRATIDARVARPVCVEGGRHPPRP